MKSTQGKMPAAQAAPKEETKVKIAPRPPQQKVAEPTGAALLAQYMSSTVETPMVVQYNAKDDRDETVYKVVENPKNYDKPWLENSDPNSKPT